MNRAYIAGAGGKNVWHSTVPHHLANGALPDKNRMYSLCICE